ncbi:Rrf2 family transcriptional regulator [Corynebacterium sp. H128]|uniref:RrF2 family transcriptional regulator n=1 Tax=unclassified Corynebacterium TaxID=2624378 RepID=UPI0030A95BB7
MRLTRFSDLGLRLLMQLGDYSRGLVTPVDRRSTVANLAVDINASEAHVARVVAKLAELGVVRSVRGRAGGVYLQEEAEALSVGAVLRQLEGRGEVINCKEPACPYAARDCLLRHRLAAAQEAFFASLDDFTVAELLRDTQVKTAVALGMPSPT